MAFVDGQRESGFEIGQAAYRNLFKSVRIGEIGGKAALSSDIFHNQSDVAVEQLKRVVVLPDHNRLSGKICQMFRYVHFAAYMAAIGFVEVFRILPPSCQNHDIRNARICGFDIAVFYRLPIGFVHPVQPFDSSVRTAFRMFQFVRKPVKQCPRPLIARYGGTGKAADAAVVAEAVAERQMGGVLRQHGRICADAETVFRKEAAQPLVRFSVQNGFLRQDR